MIIAVQTPDEKLLSLRKPGLDPLGRLELSQEDWLVVCGGFEDRALSILESATSGGPNFNVLLINYQPVVAENKADAIRTICLGKDIRISEVTYDRQEPAGFGDVFVERLGRTQGRIFIDISGMSRLLIVQVLVSLIRRPQRFNNCFIVYTEAASYPPSEAEAMEQLVRSEADPSYSIYFLSSGVYEVTLIPELSSCAPAGGQTRLVAFPSLDSHQLTALRAELQPSRISLIEGAPPGAHNRWREMAIAAVNRLDDLHKQGAERCSVSTLNYEETLACLLSIYSKHGVYERLLISPTGSKMQAVAVGLFRSFIEDTQIVYPTPRDFLKPQKYTEGVGQKHILSLEPFS
jgi:hypothetical protein